MVIETNSLLKNATISIKKHLDDSIFRNNRTIELFVNSKKSIIITKLENNMFLYNNKTYNLKHIINKIISIIILNFEKGFDITYKILD